MGPPFAQGGIHRIPNSKKEILYYLGGLFGVDTFNRDKVRSAVGQHLKYMHDTYRVHLEKNRNYERPLMIPKREWKALIEDANEKKFRKEGKTPPGPTR